MRTTFYTAAAYETLLADAYLALAWVATRMMHREYHRYLPPFGIDGVSEGSGLLVLIVATWTAVLALGCLRAGRTERDESHAPGALWFVLVLAVVWIMILLPLAIDALWNLFVRGL